MDSSLRLELLKNKTENARSAVASQEVREHLAGFIRSKRQGSTSQLDNIQEQGKTALGPTVDPASRVSNHYYSSCGASQSDDHPLRKTASMPTMHIPYKAQSLSRRRQLERRTTMSPLMRRKPKPKPNRILHSGVDRMNSNSTEYSSNPCIMGTTKGPNSRSLSQSSSPPPIDQGADHMSAHQMSLASSDKSSQRDTVQLTSEATTSSIAFPAPPQRGAEPTAGAGKQLRLTQLAETKTPPLVNSIQNQSQKSLKHQQHLKVTEAIRETLIRRTTDRQILTSASLDMNGIQTAAPCYEFEEEKAPPGAAGTSSGEFRQWSLDAADSKDGNPSKSTNSSVFHHRASLINTKRRPNPAGTSDMSIIRCYRPPSSSSSSSMTVQVGSGGTLTTGTGPPPSQHQIGAVARHLPGVLASAHNKHLYSSSSSSTSSLLSQQDSLDDSSSQAIDLSSSSERQRSTLSGSLHRMKNPNLLQHQQQQQQQQQQLVQTAASQKILQESFKQLQLCQATAQQDPAQLLLNPVQQQHLAAYSASLSPASNPVPPIMNSSARMQHTSSLDESAWLLKSAADQITLAGSAPQKMMMQPQSHMAAFPTSVTTRAQDLSQLLLAYKNLVGQQQHQSQQAIIGTSGQAEPYKTGLLSQLLQQQQHPLTSHNSEMSYPFQQQQHPHHLEPNRLAIARTLSSPLLATGGIRDKAPLSVHNTIKLAHLSSLGEKRDLSVGMQVDEPTNSVRRKESSEFQSLDLRTTSAQKKPPPAHGAVETYHLPNPPGQNLMNMNLSNCYGTSDEPIFSPRSTTGLTYDLEMCNHKCICGNDNNHPENSYRVLAIWRRLQQKGLIAKCAKIESRKASFEELRLCHSETYTQYFGKNSSERSRLAHLDLSKLPIKGLLQLECGGQGADIDTAWNEELTPRAARLATGCVIEAVLSVATGKLLNAFAIVRPPGHHAEFQQAMGFCYFNSVAIAASVLISKQLASRVLIVDWDVHHGNGIQRLFYEDKRVLYVSLHRHDRGNFFPGTGDSSELGAGSGEGYNINIAWSNEIMGDAEYLAAFRSIVMPIARTFDPSIVLVASGFDAARGHAFNFGGYHLSPHCYAFMTRQLMSLAEGRLVLCLEGGYQLNAICDCAESCVRALLNESRMDPMDKISEIELRREPNQSACETLHELLNYAVKYWPSLERWRSTIEQSALEAASLR